MQNPGLYIKGSKPFETLIFTFDGACNTFASQAGRRSFMDEEYGTYPKTAWFHFPCGQIKLSLSNNYYQESRTSPEVKDFFVAENPDPVGFSYGLGPGLSAENPNIPSITGRPFSTPRSPSAALSASRRSLSGMSKPAAPAPASRPSSAIRLLRKGFLRGLCPN